MRQLPILFSNHTVIVLFLHDQEEKANHGEDEGGSPVRSEPHRPARNRPRRRVNQPHACACGINPDLVRGLRAIDSEIKAAAQRKKRKLHEEYMAATSDLDIARKAFTDAQDKVVLQRRKHTEMK